MNSKGKTVRETLWNILLHTQIQNPGISTRHLFTDVEYQHEHLMALNLKSSNKYIANNTDVSFYPPVIFG
jgi:hypothetical protein